MRPPHWRTMPPMSNEITVRNNGPYLVQMKSCELKDAEGNPIDTGGKEMVALCRCGHTSNAPFCDGAHGREGWTPRKPQSS